MHFHLSRQFNEDLQKIYKIVALYVFRDISLKLMQIHEENLIFYKNRIFSTGCDSTSNESAFFHPLQKLLNEYLDQDFMFSPISIEDTTRIPTLSLSYKEFPKIKIISHDFRKSDLETYLFNPPQDEEARQLQQMCYHFGYTLIIFTDFLCFWLVDPQSITSNQDQIKFIPIPLLQKLRLFEWDGQDLLSLSLIADFSYALKMLINLIRIYVDYRFSYPPEIYDCFIQFIHSSPYTTNLPSEIARIIENPVTPEETNFREFLFSCMNRIRDFLRGDLPEDVGIHPNDLYTHLIIENIISTWMELNQYTSNYSLQKQISINQFNIHIPIEKYVIKKLSNGKLHLKSYPAVHRITTKEIPPRLFHSILKPIEKCLNHIDYQKYIQTFYSNDFFFVDLSQKISPDSIPRITNCGGFYDNIGPILNAIYMFLSEKSPIYHQIDDLEFKYACLVEGHFSSYWLRSNIL